MKTLGWITFAFFAISAGLYPIIYLLINANFGLLNSKPVELLESGLWNWAFYQHIFLGGIALLTGWSQFSVRLRTRNLSTHRLLGKIYVVVCILSGGAGFYLAFYATGGWVASLGFGGLAVSWLFTTSNAFLSIRNKKIDKHQQWMIRSYALTFAAVMLRIYLPLSQIAQFEFIDTYRIIAWLCWVPNLFVAEWIINNLKHSVSIEAS